MYGMYGLHAKTITNTVASASYSDDTSIVIPMSGFGLRPNHVVVRARAMVEVTANTANDLTVAYYGPVTFADDGSNVLPSVAERNIITDLGSGASTISNRTFDINETSDSFSPLTGSGGMRLVFFDTGGGGWGGSITFAMHFVVLYVE